MNCSFGISPAERTVHYYIFVLWWFVHFRFAQLDKHEKAVAGVDNGVDKVAEDGDEVVDLLDLLPLQIEERLQEHIITITFIIISIAIIINIT